MFNIDIILLTHNLPHVFIIWEYVNGPNLHEFSRAHQKELTIAFLKNLITEILKAFFAMERVNITHGDLHTGNILIAVDPRVPDDLPRIRITDFGVGYKTSTWDASDDYRQLAIICHDLLVNFIDPAELTPDDKYVYEKITQEFLRKLLEKDPTSAIYEHDPRKLLDYLDNLKKIPPAAQLSLLDPFDYLSCEQIGDSFELLQSLYSQNFLGNQDLTQRTNTILTGPRGCGKTTIFRNLSLKTKVLAGSFDADRLENFVGIYYQCSDLYYAFPHLNRDPTDEDKLVITHYFNLGLLFEILDTFSSLERIQKLDLSKTERLAIEGFLNGFLAHYESPPLGTNILNHLKSMVTLEKAIVKKWLETGRKTDPPESYLPMDFIKRLCMLLQETIPWLKDRVFYFFIDDYSLPRISRTIQIALSDFILDRNSQCFFKISTESVTTLWTVDSHGKLLEEAREYDMIDLGSYFLHASRTKKQAFLREIVNNRLSRVQKYSGFHDIAQILGSSQFESYDDLARGLRDPNTRVHYYGWNTLVDICSGDIAIFLRVIRDIFSICRDRDPSYCVKGAPGDLQDHAIRSNANDFLNRIEGAPETGQKLRHVADAFGEVAHWYLMNLDLGNRKLNPPWQAFRIEVRGKPQLSGQALKVYSDLLKYGIFFRDVRGKSQRGSVVPRLYLRRLLIPSFKLTPSRRGNIGLEPKEFVMLLSNPESFSKHMQRKKHTPRADTKQMKLMKLK